MAWLGCDVSVECGLLIYPLPEGLEGLAAATANHMLLLSRRTFPNAPLFVEINDTIAITQMLEGSGRAPDDFGLDPLSSLWGKSEEEIEDMKHKELLFSCCYPICPRPTTFPLHVNDSSFRIGTISK